MVLNEQSFTKRESYIAEQSPYYKLKMLRSRAKNGLLILTFQNALMRIGIDIDPYIVTQESLDYSNVPEIRDDKKKFIFKELDSEVIRNHYQLIGMNDCALGDLLNSNHSAYGLYYGDQLAAYMMARFGDYSFKSKSFSLKSDEAYMCGAYTYEKFRGKNLAPYLRYKCYEELNEKGITKCLSITQYFNKSSLKYKAKLNAKYKGIYLYLELFRRVSRIFTLKTYKI